MYTTITKAGQLKFIKAVEAIKGRKGLTPKRL